MLSFSISLPRLNLPLILSVSPTDSLAVVKRRAVQYLHKRDSIKGWKVGGKDSNLGFKEPIITSVINEKNLWNDNACKNENGGNGNSGNEEEMNVACDGKNTEEDEYNGNKVANTVETLIGICNTPVMALAPLTHSPVYLLVCEGVAVCDESVSCNSIDGKLTLVEIPGIQAGVAWRARAWRTVLDGMQDYEIKIDESIKLDDASSEDLLNELKVLKFQNSKMANELINLSASYVDLEKKSAETIQLLEMPRNQLGMLSPNGSHGTTVANQFPQRSFTSSTMSDPAISGIPSISVSTAAPSMSDVFVPSEEFKKPVSAFVSPVAHSQATSDFGTTSSLDSFGQDLKHRFSDFFGSMGSRVTAQTPLNIASVSPNSPVHVAFETPELCQGLLGFGPDSPFFKNEIATEEERLLNLSKNLFKIHKAAQAWIENRKSNLAASSAFFEVINNLSWSNLELFPDAPDSLSVCVKQLGESFRELQNFQNHLLISMETSLLKPIEEFYKFHVAIVRDNHQLLVQMNEECESGLQKYLASKKTNVSQMDDPQWLQIKTQRAFYEQCRFDLTFRINHILSQAKLELVDNLWAVQHHLSTYFHSGLDYTDNVVTFYRGEVFEKVQSKLSICKEMTTVAEYFMQTYFKLHFDHLETNDMYFPSLNAVRRYGASVAIFTSQELSRVDNHSAFSFFFWPLQILFSKSMEIAASPAASSKRMDIAEELSLPCFLPETIYFFSVFELKYPVSRNRAGHLIEKFGYLSKQTTSILKDWKRRWFHLKDGKLFYYRSANRSDRELVVAVLLCSVRECHNDRLNCFEIISPNRRSYVLQADTAYDMRKWIRVIQNCTEHMLASQQEFHSFQQPSSKHLGPEHNMEHLISEIRALNPFCVDCGREDPEWLSINLGVTLCIECSGIHRSLGVHVSKVRSLILDGLDPYLFKVLKNIGNDFFNSFWEGSLRSNSFNVKQQFGLVKPKNISSREDKEQWARLKYVNKAFVSKEIRDLSTKPDHMIQILFDAVMSDNINALVPLFASGVDINFQDQSKSLNTALHYACLKNSISCVEYLLQNNALCLKNADSLTPLQLAMNSGSKEVVSLFHRKGL